MFTNYILIQLNGKPFNCVLGFSLQDIILYLDFDLNSTVIEYNSVIIQNSDLDRIVAVEGDRIELLTIVGGG